MGVIQLEGFMEEEDQWWESLTVEGNLFSMVASKWKWIKVEIKRWNKGVFGDLKFHNVKTVEQIHQCNRKEAVEALLEDKAMCSEVAKANLVRIIFMEEICWGQKARELWLKGVMGNFFFTSSVTLTEVTII